MLFIVRNSESYIRIGSEYVSVFNDLPLVVGSFLLEKHVEGDSDFSENLFDLFEDEFFMFGTD